MTKIGVVIPVGPAEHHARWFDDAIASVVGQTRAADHILIVDDMHGSKGIVEVCRQSLLDWELYSPPWLLGVAGAFNHGVAQAFRSGCDLALMMGADDVLEPRVLERVVTEYEQNGNADGYYWCDVIYQDGTEQALPCNNAAVTRGFMRATGGLPMDASSGAMDAALISALLVHRRDLLVHVPGGSDARFWSRQHPQQETARLNRYAAANAIIRDVFTEKFEAPEWGRYA